MCWKINPPLTGLIAMLMAVAAALDVALSHQELIP